MGEPSPTLSHVNFELHNYIPPTLRSSSDAHRSGHDSVENLTTDGILLDFGMDDTSHPSPFFPSSDLNTFNHRPGNEGIESLESNLTRETPTSFQPSPQTTSQRNACTMATANGDDIRDSIFESVQDTSQHPLQGAGGQLCLALARPSLHTIHQVCESYTMYTMN